MEDELYHYGIKGMKWGVRRTPEQLGHAPKKKRSIKKTAKNAVDKTVRFANKHKNYKRTIVRKTATDEELKSRKERLQLETDVKRLEWESESEYKQMVHNYKNYVIGGIAVVSGQYFIGKVLNNKAMAAVLAPAAVGAILKKVNK